MTEQWRCTKHGSISGPNCLKCEVEGHSKALDTQIGGDHYKKLKIQPMEYSMANGLNACQHTIIKYVTRYKDKGGIQDLEKAKHCIDMLIEFEQKDRTAQQETVRFDEITNNRHRQPIKSYTGCLVCGEYTDHGGLQCPQMRPTANAN